MEKKRVVLQSLLVMAALLFCMANVSSAESNVKIEDHLTDSEVVKGPNRRLFSFVDCGGRCKVRCSLHSRPNVCTRACETCCARCKCVPPGTYGNREMCGSCYTDMMTHGNKPKCP
ncbi:gibberellin-regulated protein 3-like [Gastrolobium bilobum]|uniref:gibberellin-regulated protein 3-like n=1 Tax=Gastrolobium bilobum TaxID=150636 RepID=UPI002AAFBB48|nr:gibberellin-regulated protein 3-like [Gastrolobium bilobum]